MSEQTQEYVLRAMGRNYADGNSWDRLDREVVIKAADEIKALREANKTFADCAVLGVAQPPTDPFIQGVREALIEKCARIADAKAADELAIFEQAADDRALTDTGRISIQEHSLARKTLAQTIAREIRRIPSPSSTDDGSPAQ